MALTSLLEQALANGSQASLAAKVGVAQTTISAWARGAHLPPNTRIPALAAALGMPADELRALVARERGGRLVQGQDLAGSCSQDGAPADAGAQR